VPELDDRELWARVLKSDEASHEFFSERQDWPGATVFTNAVDAAFNLAVIDQPDPGAADDLLESLARHYRAMGVRPRVRITPLSLPEDLPDRLARRGFSALEEDELFMIREGAWESPLSDGVTVKHVPAEATLEESARVQHTVFSGDESGYPRALELARRGVARGKFRCYLALLQGEAVGAATAHLENGLAGVYGLATLPAARRRGVASSLVTQIAREAWEEGARAFYLSTEPHGDAVGLYSKLGFVPAFTVRNYALPDGPV
jgi:ribosomal protein S18 acetylase RimI-like enzyme